MRLLLPAAAVMIAVAVMAFAHASPDNQCVLAVKNWLGYSPPLIPVWPTYSMMEEDPYVPEAPQSMISGDVISPRVSVDPGSRGW